MKDSHSAGKSFTVYISSDKRYVCGWADALGNVVDYHPTKRNPGVYGSKGDVLHVRVKDLHANRWHGYGIPGMYRMARLPFQSAAA